MRDIKAMLPEEIAAALAEMGQPKYRAKQIFQLSLIHISEPTRH